MKKSKIKSTTYGGYIGWVLRKHFSFITSNLYIKWQYCIRRRLFKDYMTFFDGLAEKNNYIEPCLISIETINRCNSTCSFCPASKGNETRPLKKMDENLFRKIIQDLKDMDYSGYLNLYVNNEPFIDNRIEDWYAYAKRELPKAKMLLYTNGTLLTIERFKKIILYIDKCIINNYTNEYKLHDNIKELIEFVNNNKEYWNCDITVQIRYIDEILTNRAGVAPNKQKVKTNNMMCTMPYTDITIYPDGAIGLCCNDAKEQTNYGNIQDTSIEKLWKSKIYYNLRKNIGQNRSQYSFCDGCDFVDAGIRNIFMKENLKRYTKNKSSNI